MDVPAFRWFVGIDWSGAKGDVHRGIAVAICSHGDAPPEVIAPPSAKRGWSRVECAQWLRELTQDGPVLAGIDFAFAHAYLDAGGYYPDVAGAPHSPAALWAMIDAANSDKPDLYGGGLWAHKDFGPFYNAPGQRGEKFTSRRRLTEMQAASVRSPSPTFNCVGPAGVGTGSLAGMRFLHHMQDIAAIWPFQPPSGPLTLVEIFPSYYFAMAGIRPVNGQHGQAEILNQALAHFHTQPMAEGFRADGPDADQADAVIASAALRALAADEGCWSAAEEEAMEAARQEGWIFGVKSAKDEG